MAESSYMIGPGERDAFLRRKLAAELYQKSTQPQQISHWTQGLAQLLNAGMSGYDLHSLDKQEKEGFAAQRDAMRAILEQDGPVASPQQAAPVTPPNPAMTPPMGNAGPPVTPPVGGAPLPQTAESMAVQPSPKVWGYEEGVKAGLYDPPAKPVQMAQASPQEALPQSAPQTAPNVNGGIAAPGFTPQPGLNKDALVASLSKTGTPANPQTAKIAAMLNHPNPYVQKMGMQLGQGIAAQQFTPKTTDEIKEYEYNQKNPGFKDYKTDLKRAGAIQNQVVIDQKGETAFNTEAGKVQAKRFDEIAGEGPKAKQMASDIETLRVLGDQIKTGKLAEAKAVIGPYADALGIKVDGLNEIQAFEAIVNRVAPNMRVPGSGAQSDYELRNFLKSMLTLGNTPEGNALIARTMQGFIQNKTAAAEIASRALNGDIKRPEAEKMLRELPDPMAEWREAQKAAKKSTSPSAGKAQPTIDDLVKKYTK